MKNRTAIAVMFAVVVISGACAPPEEEAPKIPAEQAVSELVIQWDNAMRTGEVDGAVAHDPQ